MPFRSADGLLVTGTGLFHIAGFDDTPGTYSLAVTNAGSAFSFSATDTATAIPEPHTLVLFGMALLAGGRRWRGNRPGCPRTHDEAPGKGKVAQTMRTVLLGPHRPRARRSPCRWLLLSLALLSACTIEPAPTGPTTVTQTTTVVTTYPLPPTPAPPSVPVPGGANPPTSTGRLPRTPDPVNGGTLPLPTYGQSVTQTYAASAAGQAALANSCPTGNSSTTWAFMDGLVDQLRQRDSRWGYLCKRGNCFDPSADVVAYHATAGPDVTGAAGVIGVDVIGDLCGAATPQWFPMAFDPAAIWTSRGRF